MLNFSDQKADAARRNTMDSVALSKFKPHNFGGEAKSETKSRENLMTQSDVTEDKDVLRPAVNLAELDKEMLDSEAPSQDFADE